MTGNKHNMLMQQYCIATTSNGDFPVNNQLFSPKLVLNWAKTAVCCNNVAGENKLSQ